MSTPRPIPWWRRWFGQARDHDAATAPPEDVAPVDAGPQSPIAHLEAALTAKPPDAARVSAALGVVVAAGGARSALGLGVRAAVAGPLPEATVRELVALADRLGELGLARRVAAAAVEREPERPALHAMAADLAERAGDGAGALRAWEHVLFLDFGYPGARERAARLGAGAPREASAGAVTLLAGGAVVGERYRVEREVGRGGAGIVFAARDTRLDRPVALKIGHAAGPRERARLEVEALTPARIPHPGVIRVLDRPEGLVGLVMEWLPRGSLREALSRGPVDAARARRWLATAAEALAHVHAAGVVHRDVKPSNLLLRGDDRIVLTDFGASCAVGDPGGGEGTLAYMAPEQRAGAPAAAAADVHALGRVLGEVVAASGGAAPGNWTELAEAMQRPDPGARPTAAEVHAVLAADGAERLARGRPAR